MGQKSVAVFVFFLFYSVITEWYDWHGGMIKCYYVICFSVYQRD